MAGQHCMDAAADAAAAPEGPTAPPLRQGQEAQPGPQGVGGQDQRLYGQERHPLPRREDGAGPSAKRQRLQLLLDVEEGPARHPGPRAEQGQPDARPGDRGQGGHGQDEAGANQVLQAPSSAWVEVQPPLPPPGIPALPHPALPHMCRCVEVRDFNIFKNLLQEHVGSILLD